uniref:Mediator of RNA polymerase II transcription subunit 20 n=1 Tax=Strongyloides stercoralis TaxID=6248 RepID=A0AAF5D992_STRER
MGVSWVFLSNQTVPEIKDSIEAEGAFEVGTYNVELHQIVPNEKLRSSEKNGMNNVYVVHHDEYPGNSFVYQIPFKDGSKFIRVTSLRSIDGLFTKYDDAVEFNPEGAMIISGKTYQLEDIVIRVGTASCRSSCCGTVIELEITPSYVLGSCFGFLKEVLNTLFPKEYSTIVKPKFFDAIAKEKYIPAHTMLQYMMQYDNLKARAT